MLLLDTHVLLWHERGDRRLGRRTRRMLARGLRSSNLAVSAMSFWEVGMQIRKGRLELGLDPDHWRIDLLQHGLIEIPVGGSIASRAGLLPDMHADPADRIIVATALEGHQLLTADRRILEWPGDLSRMRATD